MGRKGRYNPPTEAEREVIHAFLDGCDNDPPFGYSEGLLPLLPGRSKQDIRNHVNLIKRKRLGECPRCNTKLPKDFKYKYCDACRAHARQKRGKAVSKGMCAYCQSRPVGGDGGTVTVCSFCMVGRRERYKSGYYKERFKRHKEQKKVKDAKKPQRGFNLLNWLTSKTTAFALNQMSKTGDLIVDLFGGSGDLTMRAAVQGYNVLAYNDIHPLLVEYIRVIQAGQVDELVTRIKQSTSDPTLLKPLYEMQLSQASAWVDVEDHKYHALDPGDPDWTITLGRAAAMYVMCHSIKGHDMVNKPTKPFTGVKKGHRARMKEAHQALGDVEVTCLDFHEAIDWHDCDQTVFYVDPPWIKDGKYEYNIDGRHADLVSHLLDARGRFIMVLDSTRLSLEAMQDCPHLYWLTSIGLAKLLVGSDFELEGKGLVEVDRTKFDYLKQAS